MGLKNYRSDHVVTHPFLMTGITGFNFFKMVFLEKKPENFNSKISYMIGVHAGIRQVLFTTLS